MTICKGCSEPCRIVDVDFGIGAYEYWGATGFDSQVAQVSNCCEADFSDDDDEALEPPDDHEYPPEEES